MSSCIVFDGIESTKDYLSDEDYLFALNTVVDDGAPYAIVVEDSGVYNIAENADDYKNALNVNGDSEITAIVFICDDNSFDADFIEDGVIEIHKGKASEILNDYLDRTIEIEM